MVAGISAFLAPSLGCLVPLWDNMSAAQVARTAAVHGDVPFLFPRPYLRHGDEGQLGHSAIRVTPPRLHVPARGRRATSRWADA